MKYYKVYTDFKNYIPIDETELSKALTAFMKGVGAIFNEGATKRIDMVVPDYNRMMGWNPGYAPSPSEQGEISSSKICREARFLMASVKSDIQLGQGDDRLLIGN